jgi:hypothetical protein
MTLVLVETNALNSTRRRRFLAGPHVSGAPFRTDPKTLLQLRR